jgi:hypothetical protein
VRNEKCKERDECKKCEKQTRCTYFSFLASHFWFLTFLVPHSSFFTLLAIYPASTSNASPTSPISRFYFLFLISYIQSTLVSAMWFFISRYRDIWVLGLIYAIRLNLEGTYSRRNENPGNKPAHQNVNTTHFYK